MTSYSQRILRNPATGADLELFRHVETQLYTAVVSDALDELGYRNQALREFMRPLAPDDCFAGWARTLACVDTYYISSDPYAMENVALDSVILGDVVVASTADSLQNAPWGAAVDGGACARSQRCSHRRLGPRCEKDPGAAVPGVCARNQTRGLEGPRSDSRLQRADRMRRREREARRPGVRRFRRRGDCACRSSPAGDPDGDREGRQREREPE